MTQREAIINYLQKVSPAYATCKRIAKVCSATHPVCIRIIAELRDWGEVEEVAVLSADGRLAFRWVGDNPDVH